MKTDNELIAEFMGYSVRYFGPVLYFSDEDGFIDFTGDARTFMPHLSWNDIMSVVEKIESDLIHPKFIFAVHIGKTVVDIVCVLRPAGEDPPHDIVVYKNPNNLNKIEMTYQAVVEFIKWHSTG